MGNIKSFNKNFICCNSDFNSKDGILNRVLIPVVIYFLFLTGCSTYYSVNEFGSKKDYYNYLNEHIDNKRLFIYLKNDSILTTAYGAKILTDSLLFETDKIQKKNEEIPLTEISSINYESVDYKSAYLSLKNGRELYAENMVIQPNMLKCKTSEKFIIKTFVPISTIKEINYNNRLKGIIPGFLSGLLGGGIFGCFAFNFKSGGNPPLQTDHFQGTLLGVITGVFTGILTGFIIGYSYNYHF